jgi:hypothetical protein
MKIVPYMVGRAQAQCKICLVSNRENTSWIYSSRKKKRLRRRDEDSCYIFAHGVKKWEKRSVAHGFLRWFEFGRFTSSRGSNHSSFFLPSASQPTGQPGSQAICAPGQLSKCG